MKNRGIFAVLLISVLFISVVAHAESVSAANSLTPSFFGKISGQLKKIIDAVLIKGIKNNIYSALEGVKGITTTVLPSGEKVLVGVTAEGKLIVNLIAWLIPVPAGAAIISEANKLSTSGLMGEYFGSRMLNPNQGPQYVETEPTESFNNWVADCKKQNEGKIFKLKCDRKEYCPEHSDDSYCELAEESPVVLGSNLAKPSLEESVLPRKDERVTILDKFYDQKVSEKSAAASAKVIGQTAESESKTLSFSMVLTGEYLNVISNTQIISDKVISASLDNDPKIKCNNGNCKYHLDADIGFTNKYELTVAQRAGFNEPAAYRAHIANKNGFESWEKYQEWRDELKGLSKTERPISVSSNILHYREAYLMGSHGSTPRHHKSALDLISSGKINVKALISHRFSLQDIRLGLDLVENRQGQKVVITPHA